ncbi:MAG: NAD(P)H-hydrate dehydratase [Bacteroidota bacterium]
MQHILTPEEMRAADAAAMNEYKISSAILMENAAHSFCDILIDDILPEYDPAASSVLILCGSGNNGGDGFAVARHLNDFFNVRVIWNGSVEKMSEETRANYERLKMLGMEIIHIKEEKELDYIQFNEDIIIDSILGVGGSDNLRGLAVPIMQKANSTQSLRIALDTPTGLNSETGAADLNCFRAHCTITMFAPKTGMLRGRGLNNCGEIFTAYLGAPMHIAENLASVKILSPDDIDGFILPRKRITNKFDYGRVVVVSGSLNMPGAAAMVSNTALLGGAGLVYLFTPNVHSSVWPEVIPAKTSMNDNGAITPDSYDMIMEKVEKSNVLALGPGLSSDPDAVELVRKLIYNIPVEKRIIIDADAVKAVDSNKKLSDNVIITPHTGEFAGLTGIDRQEVEAAHHELAVEWADKLACTILLKYIPTVITDADQTYWTISGNPGMATAGSGDILTGLMAGIAASQEHLLPVEIAALSSYIHGLAGDMAAKKYGETSLKATDLQEFIRELLP